MLLSAQFCLVQTLMVVCLLHMVPAIYNASVDDNSSDSLVADSMPDSTIDEVTTTKTNNVKGKGRAQMRVKEGPKRVLERIVIKPAKSNNDQLVRSYNQNYPSYSSSSNTAYNYPTASANYYSNSNTNNQQQSQYYYATPSTPAAYTYCSGRQCGYRQCTHGQCNLNGCHCSNGQCSCRNCANGVCSYNTCSCQGR